MGSPRWRCEAHTLHQGAGHWSGSGCIVKGGPTGFPGGSDTECERGFGLCRWKDEVAKNGGEGSFGRSRLGHRDWELSFEHAKSGA